MKKQLPLLIILVLAIAFITACTKIVTTDIGGDLIPPIDGVNTKEMFLDVTSKNMKDTIVKVGIGTPNALGYISNDPLFGKTSASINVELKPSVFPVYPVNGTDIKIDSVVLVLGYSGVWGDTTVPLGFRVYKIKNTDASADVLRSDTTYATNYQVERGDELTENYAAANIDITKLNDSIYPFEEAATNQLRIRLNKSYGDELLNDYDTTSTGAYHSDSLFQRFFKGYQIVPETGMGNALLKINLLDTNTKLAVYYNFNIKDSINKRDTAVRYYRTNNYSCGSSNYVTRDRSGTAIPSYIPTNGNINDSLLFIDANPGIYTKITIDSLATLSNRIIHRAELVMEQVPGDPINDALFTAPNLFLTPYSLDSMRRFALPHDVLISNGTVGNQLSYGCIPNKKIDPITQQTIYFYTFDISRYAQGIVTRHEKSYPLILYAPSNDYIYPLETSIYQVYTGTSGPLNTPAIGRVRLGGGNSVNHKMRLHIVYSDIQ
ncbi:DUF4270 family protein [Panacibacter ginsenosidivorans]|uniref:DUF4270 family protein n=1 Tax=Panacibacter ginsenosidivorans TaxID=1813871 RepID=UPI001315AC7D|nr:DUF4270 family protein [Panacibacter ginsenosidivorans]